MNTNVTGFTPLNTIRVLNIDSTCGTIALGAPLALTGFAYIMDSSIGPRTLPDGEPQTTRLRIPTVVDIRSHRDGWDDCNYIGMARDPIPVGTILSTVTTPDTYMQDGIGDCVLDGVCYVIVSVPAQGTPIAVGDALYFDVAGTPTMVTSIANVTDATYSTRQVGIALGTCAANTTATILAFIDQFPRLAGAIVGA